MTAKVINYLVPNFLTFTSAIAADKLEFKLEGDLGSLSDLSRPSPRRSGRRATRPGLWFTFGRGPLMRTTRRVNPRPLIGVEEADGSFKTPNFGLGLSRLGDNIFKANAGTMITGTSLWSI